MDEKDKDPRPYLIIPILHPIPDEEWQRAFPGWRIIRDIGKLPTRTGE